MQALDPSIAKTSYCSYGFPYRKNEWLANNFGLVLKPECDKTSCEQMVAGRHLCHAQKGGGGATNKYHTRDELHRIPPSLCKDIILQMESVHSDAFDF